MIDDNQPDALDDELLSAYIDDELTVPERMSVEDRLANDDNARRLISELRALSESLQSLPKQRLGEDLREQVLQRAEREMLIGDDDSITVPIASKTVQQIEDVRSSTRKWIWAGCAIAAALLLMFYQPRQADEDRRLADAKPQKVLPPAVSEKRTVPQLSSAPADNQAASKSSGSAEMESVIISDGRISAADESQAKARLRSRQTSSPPTELDQNEPAWIVHVTLHGNREETNQFNQWLNNQGLKPLQSSDESTPASGLQKKDGETILVEVLPNQIDALLQASLTNKELDATIQFASDESKFKLEKSRLSSQEEVSTESAKTKSVKDQEYFRKEIKGLTDDAKTPIRVLFQLHWKTKVNPK